MNAIHCLIATPADLPKLDSLMQMFYAEQSLAYGPATRDALRQLIDSPAHGRACLIKAHHAHGAPVGYFILTYMFSVERGGRAALLDELYIDPAARNLGNGSAALRAAIEMARANHCRSVHLEVDRANRGARKLYETLGFVAQDREFLTLLL